MLPSYGIVWNEKGKYYNAYSGDHKPCPSGEFPIEKQSIGDDVGSNCRSSPPTFDFSDKKRQTESGMSHEFWNKRICDDTTSLE